MSKFVHQLRKKRLDDKLSAARLLTLINCIADAVVAIDHRGIVTLYNAAALDMLSTHSDLTKHQFNRLFKLKDTQGKAVDIITLLGRNTIIRRDDLSFINTDGSQVLVDITVSAALNQGRHQPSEYIVIVRDITRQKSIDEERDEFIAVASHELKTPVATAEAMLSTVLLPGFTHLEPKAQELLSQAHDSLIFLGALLTDMTTLARAQRDVLGIDLQRIEPAKVLEAMAQNYRTQAQAKGLKLIVKTKPGTPSIVTSEYRLMEILQNLISNALKYTEKGGITLTAQPGEHGGVRFSIKDSGIGISATDQRKLFTKFFRSEDYRTRKTGGTGLGLYVSYKLAERLNGRIWATSRLNVGSTFYLEVPSVSAHDDGS